MAKKMLINGKTSGMVEFERSFREKVRMKFEDWLNQKGLKTEGTMSGPFKISDDKYMIEVKENTSVPFLYKLH